MSTVTNPLAAGNAILRAPIADPKTGMPTWGALQWINDVQVRLSNALNKLGQFVGSIAPTAHVVGHTEPIGTTLQYIDSAGVMTPPGLPAATEIDQGAVLLPAGSPGNTLGSAAFEPVAAFDAAGSAAAAQAAAEAYASDASNLASGTVAAARLPNLSAMPGQITAAQGPAAGFTGIITTAKLTGGGANGTMTFTNGILTAQVPAT